MELKENWVGLSQGCLSVPEFLLLREWKPWNGDSSLACLPQTSVWKAEEGCLGFCLSWSRSQRVWVWWGGGGIWWMGRQVCCSAVPTGGASHHALHALSENSLWPWVWCRISHTLANSNKNSPLSLLLHLHINQYGEMFLIFKMCEEPRKVCQETGPEV